MGLSVNVSSGGPKFGLVLALVRGVKNGFGVSVSTGCPKWGLVLALGDVQNGA